MCRGGDEAHGPVSVVTVDWHPVGMDGRMGGWEDGMGGSKGGGVSDGQKEPLQPWGAIVSIVRMNDS